MKLKILTGGLFAIALLALPLSAQAQETAKKIRVGVYDNRAIALAYFGSDYNEFIKKRSEFQEVQKSGDSARIEELNEWVGKFQRQIHFQGFCRAPVDDLLLLVKDKMAGLASRTGVDIIGWYPDYTGAEVEIVDITDELVALFNPSESKLKEIKGLKGVEPIALSDVEHDH